MHYPILKYDAMSFFIHSRRTIKVLKYLSAHAEITRGTRLGGVLQKSNKETVCDFIG